MALREPRVPEGSELPEFIFAEYPEPTPEEAQEAGRSFELLVRDTVRHFRDMPGRRVHTTTIAALGTNTDLQVHVPIGDGVSYWNAFVDLKGDDAPAGISRVSTRITPDYRGREYGTPRESVGYILGADGLVRRRYDAGKDRVREEPERHVPEDLAALLLIADATDMSEDDLAERLADMLRRRKEERRIAPVTREDIERSMGETFAHVMEAQAREQALGLTEDQLPLVGPDEMAALTRWLSAAV